MRRNMLMIVAVAVLLSAASMASAAATSSEGDRVGPDRGTVVSVGALRDLQPKTTNPTDGASAALVTTAEKDSMRHRLVVWGLDRSSTGRTFGVHVHVGPCVPGNGDAAGDHYNTGGVPSPTTEVWLDLTVGPGGAAWSRTTTPFVIPDGGANALVIHELPTDSTGEAGDRLACIPAPY